jgi:hypothetical protein
MAWACTSSSTPSSQMIQACTPLRDGRRGDGQLPHLLGLQASGVTLGDAGSFGSLPQVIGRVFGEVTVMALGDPSGFKVGACPHLIRAAIGLRQRRAR